MQARELSIDAGSSPLTRGKRHACLRRRSRAGLIPAHAGKTLPNPVGGLLVWAHPRSRGENMVVCDRSGQSVGSSPLTRGKPDGGGVRDMPPRLIPAHAGKTSIVLHCHRSQAAHPRSRGENLERLACVRGRPGSSPLTRGKRND